MTGENASAGHQVFIVVTRVFVAIMGTIAIGAFPTVASWFGTTPPDGIQLVLYGMLVGGLFVDVRHRRAGNV